MTPKIWPPNAGKNYALPCESSRPVKTISNSRPQALKQKVRRWLQQTYHENFQTSPALVAVGFPTTNGQSLAFGLPGIRARRCALLLLQKFNQPFELGSSSYHSPDCLIEGPCEQRSKPWHEDSKILVTAHVALARFLSINIQNSMVNWTQIQPQVFHQTPDSRFG